ncbi:unnamed protein product [Rotaria sp. Silwood1]|nr:unnamed protein product [Rotaria sp. Silwood1]CAF0948257.1 unnamed protein product [Rotaria sp. Silwood1]CAF3384542.1 unnamed protein product [Rotaria sp. Silwood1]CAF3399628.1 unnamed protein product [Rotaria sp. Silwood1]CAF4496761.1 unnamed protein product [Rotaria sp. Silwood1]
MRHELPLQNGVDDFSNEGYLSYQTVSFMPYLFIYFLGNNNSEPIDAAINSQSVPNVNNQLFEQLITETAKVEEQRNTIEQLERDKSNLTDQIHRLEKKATKRK